VRNIKTATTKGLTAIELLIVTSVIAVIAVFATPMMSSVFLETDLDKAVKITQDSIDKARISARLYNTSVFMTIGTIETSPGHAIKVLIPQKDKQQVLNDMEHIFPLPESVRVVSGDMLIQFDSNGQVDFPAMLLLASSDGELKRKEFLIK
jgi:prepilin-type N-terminal cleavage/methylation domain-containing protein